MSDLISLPHYQQSAEGYCLPACARMVLAYLGLELTEAEVSRTLGAQEYGTPQIVTIDFNGTPVTLLHFHPTPTNLGPQDQMDWSVRERERQARIVADWVAAHPGPLIAPVDFNACDQSVAYAIVTSILVDSWREAGWGLGHTFPGADSPGSSRATIGGIPVPMWLTRIDHVFHSRHWQANSAWLGPWDGVSDHRPVMARLTLVK